MPQTQQTAIMAASSTFIEFLTTTGAPDPVCIALEHIASVQNAVLYTNGHNASAILLSSGGTITVIGSYDDVKRRLQMAGAAIL
jgi:hypothetical protein